MRSQLEACRSWVARTKAPGRSCTALRRVLKSPPVSGARKMSACCASWGTVTNTPSLRGPRAQVSTRVNQSLGGGLVAPRRKATTRTKWVDWLSGRSGWIQSRSPGIRLEVWLMGRVMSPLLTCTSTFGPVRSKAGLSACNGTDRASTPNNNRGKQRRISLLYGDGRVKQNWAAAQLRMEPGWNRKILDVRQLGERRCAYNDLYYQRDSFKLHT